MIASTADLRIGMPVRWHRPYDGRSHHAFLVDGSVGVVSMWIPGDYQIDVRFEGQNRDLVVDLRDLTVIHDAPGVLNEEGIEAWLST